MSMKLTIRDGKATLSLLKRRGKNKLIAAASTVVADTSPATLLAAATKLQGELDAKRDSGGS